MPDHLDYPAFFHPEQSPLWLAAVLAALGRTGPAAETAICEIGCGQGFGLCLLAAANPGRRFVGIDISARDIARARTRAGMAGLGNIDFIEADIRDAAALPEGAFGIILSHGLLSWVAGDAREALFDFVAARLAPDGVAALHYMSAPGGDALRPLHRLFQTLSAHPDPIGEGLSLLQQLRDGGAGYFQLHPHLGQTLEGLLREPKGYVAQEFLGPVFDPLSFAEVAGLAGARGLDFIGSATPIENIDTASLPGDLSRIASRAGDNRILSETLKDLIRNQALRYDLYQRTAAPLEPQAHMAALCNLWWGLLPGAPKLDAGSQALAFPTRIGTIEGDPAIFGPLLDRLGEGPARFDELMALPVFASRPGLLNQVLQMGLHGRILHPVQPFETPLAAKRLNQQLLDEFRAGVTIPALAAPPLGSGFALPRRDLEMLVAGGAPTYLHALLAL